MISPLKFPLVRNSSNLRRAIREIRKSIHQYRKYPNRFHNQDHVTKMLEHVELKGQTLLIVGVGKGLEVPTFFQEGCHTIIGLDPYPEIEENIWGSKFKILEESAESISLPDESCDAIYSVATLEHVPNPEKAVTEMMRVLKSGGKLYCSTIPLWFSAYGYHAKKHYPELHDPWFHLAYSEEEYIRHRPALQDKSEYLDRLDVIYNHETNYNRLPSKIYYETVEMLMKEHFPIKIEFHGIDQYTKLLAGNQSLAQKLAGYSTRDLITTGFTAIVQKQ